MPASFRRGNAGHLMLRGGVVLATTILYFFSRNPVRGEIKVVDFYGGGTQCMTQGHWDAKCIDHAQTSSGKACTSLLHCVVDCLKNPTCIGVSKTADTESFFNHYPCSVDSATSSGCTSQGTETKHSYYSKKCDHNGKFQPEDESCACVDGWVGPICQTYPMFCVDLKTAGYKNGYYNVLLDLDGTGSNLVPCKCLAWDDVSHIEILETYGTKTFDRPWADYRDGFTSWPQLWAGLENWHQLSSHGYRTAHLKVWVSGMGYLRREYDNFQVAGESQNYAFTFDSSVLKGDAEGDHLTALGCSLDDCFGTHQNVPFSTRDRDQDGVNCASASGQGWWFPQGCNLACNLLGSAPTEWGPETPVRERLSIAGMEACMTSFPDKDWTVQIIIGRVV